MSLEDANDEGVRAVVPPPQGWVTLAFTDVQSSTLLWEQHAEGMSRALQLHFRRIREQIREFAGYEVKTEGDAFMVAFSSSASALSWACAVQESLLTESWPPEILQCAEASEVRQGDAVIFRGLRVRMGLHCGTPELLQDAKSGRVDYFGRMVNLASRVTDAARGGEILVTQELWRDVARLTPTEPWLVAELGTRRLKSIEKPVTLLQVLPKALAGRARYLGVPRDRAAAPPAKPVTTMFGRQEEMKRLATLDEGGAKLVTLHGPPGVGKSLLAAEYVRRLMAAGAGAADTLVFCDLVEAKEPMDACRTLASQLGLTVPATSSSDDLVFWVADVLARRSQLLVVLDNFEHLARWSSMIKKWMARAEGVRFLVTSRELLRLAGEQSFDVLPLAATDATALFMDRARVRPADLTEEDTAAIAEITAMVEGIPLAIELAAGRMNLLTPRAIRDRLKVRFDLLVSSRRDLPARQASVEGSLAWSWDQLSPEEQGTLADCSVFRGGFDVESAEAVVSLADAGTNSDILDLLQSLRDKSIFRGDASGSSERLGMYRIVQDFASRRAAGSPREAAAIDRHRAYFSHRARELHAKLHGPDKAAAVSALTVDFDNHAEIIHRAAGRSLPEKEAAEVLSVALVLHDLLLINGPSARALALVEGALAAAAHAPAELLTQARAARAQLQNGQRA